MTQVLNCPVCNSEKLKSLHGYEKFHLSKCGNCNMVFANKIPEIAELESHYNQYTREDYLSPITIKRYNELLDKFEKYKHTGKILDVGCGIGYFLEQAKKRGWDVYGTEFTSDAVSICEGKGIKMTKGALNIENYQLEDFDVVTSFEVIEHLTNPIEEMDKFSHLLRKGGLLYVTTPNFNSVLRHLLKSNYNVISFPEHLLYFTKRTLNRALRKSNFRVMATSSSGLSMSRAKAGMNLKAEKPIQMNSHDEKIRALANDNFFFKGIVQLINIVLNKTGLGDALKSFSIKS
ncbi:MAG: hypothetical protein COB85_08175 [Bacteroidetes bacterium]|nr:MAG: hypothetical protein COB85_08175 [Bacteroidota bacterium]